MFNLFLFFLAPSRNAPKEDPPLPKLLRASNEDGTASPGLNGLNGLSNGVAASALGLAAARSRRAPPRRSVAHADNDEWTTVSANEDDSGDEEEPNYKHRCEHCSKGFHKQYEYKKHVENVHNNKCR